MESWLGELIAKIEANDRQIDYINRHALPRGVRFEVRNLSHASPGGVDDAWRRKPTASLRVRHLGPAAFAECTHCLGNGANAIPYLVARFTGRCR